MSGTAFQFIFDNAETISIMNDAVTAQTISRDQTVKTVRRNYGRFKFEVSLPNGMPWDQVRGNIALIDAMGQHTSGNVQLSNSGYVSWMSKYQGSSPNYTGFTASYVPGATSVTLTSTPTTPSGYYFKAGDFIQLTGLPTVYSVTADVAVGNTTVPIHRIITATSSGSANLKVGPDVVWNLICVNKPTHTIFSRNQVSWSGPFMFYETTQV